MLLQNKCRKIFNFEEKIPFKGFKGFFGPLGKMCLSVKWLLRPLFVFSSYISNFKTKILQFAKNPKKEDNLKEIKKYHIRETPTLLANADSRTDTIKSNPIQTSPCFKGYLFDPANRLLPGWSCQLAAAWLILPIGCYLVDPAKWLLPGWSCQSAATWLILPFRLTNERPGKKLYEKGTYRYINRHHDF